MRRGLVAAIVTAALLHSSDAWPCQCLWVSPDGFVATAAAKHLPANAKGVLFLRTGPGKVDASQFSAVDTATQRKLSVRVRSLDVAAAGDSRARLFRIEPVKGFEPGHTYAFSTTALAEPTGGYGRLKATARALTVVIDSARIPDRLSGAVAVRAEPIQTEQVSVAEGGSCSANILARAEKLHFDVTRELEPYRDSILVFTEYADAANGARRPWHYAQSACSSVGWGRTDVGELQELFFAPCKGRAFRNEPLVGHTYAVEGQYGFLEVDDALRTTSAVNVTFEASHGECDSERYSQRVLKEPKSAEEICQYGASTEPPTAELLEGLARFTAHSQAEYRRCAAQALQRVPYKISNARDPALFAVLESKVLPGLGSELTDTDPQVRKLAATALTSYAHVWGDPKRSPALRFSAVFPQLRQALADPAPEVRVAVGETITRLGPSGQPLGDALISAIEDTSKPNYAAPPALAAADPSNPKTIPTLIAALHHPDSIERDTAASALGTVGQSSPEVISALMTAAEAGTSNAIEALGMLKEKAARATPLLLKLARTSPWPYVRQKSFAALASIGEDPKAVIQVLVDNMEHPSGEYLRTYAIEALGKMGSQALPAVPAMAALTAQTLTTPERGALVRAWQRIRPPASEIEPALRRIAQDDHSWPRDEALRYLRELGSSPR